MSGVSTEAHRSATEHIFCWTFPPFVKFKHDITTVTTVGLRLRSGALLSALPSSSNSAVSFGEMQRCSLTASPGSWALPDHPLQLFYWIQGQSRILKVASTGLVLYKSAVEPTPTFSCAVTSNASENLSEDSFSLSFSSVCVWRGGCNVNIISFISSFPQLIWLPTHAELWSHCSLTWRWLDNTCIIMQFCR